MSEDVELDYLRERVLHDARDVDRKLGVPMTIERLRESIRAYDAARKLRRARDA